jgi:hypothetical protein
MRDRRLSLATGKKRTIARRSFCPAVGRVTRATLVALVAAAGLSCDRRAPSAPSGGAVENASGLSFCVNEINRYREGVGRPLLARSQVLEDYAAVAAERDALAHSAHRYFLQTNGGGTATAETEILWWRGMEIKAVLQGGIAQMWQAGPNSEHYDILIGPYSEIGCGIFVNGAEVTVAQDFR